MSATVLRSKYWQRVLAIAVKSVGYVWGGRLETGLDCSGFVTLPLFQASNGIIDWRFTHNTDELWKLPRVKVGELLVGDLCLYWGQNSKGEHDVSHVMVYAGNGAVVGQAYGGPSDTDPARSREQGRVTQALPMFYRDDFAGCVRLPLV